MQCRCQKCGSDFRMVWDLAQARTASLCLLSRSAWHGCIHPRGELFLNTFQPSRDPSTGLHGRHQQNGTANQY